MLGMYEGDNVGVAVDGTGVGTPGMYVGTAVGSTVGAGDGRTVGAVVGK